MRSFKPVVLGAIFVAIPMAARADTLVTKLRVTVEAFSIRKIDAATPTRVVFAGSPIKGEATLAAALLPSSKSGPASMSLPASDWWEHVTWQLEREEGGTTGFRPRWLSGERGGAQVRSAAADRLELNAGERLVAHFEAGALSPGKYRLVARLGALRSEPEWFLVSTGEENADLRREFAR